MSNICTAYYEESSGVIYHYDIVDTGEAVRFIDFDGQNWIADGSDFSNCSDEDREEFPISVPVYHSVTGALHGRVHIDTNGDFTYLVAS